MYSEPTSLHICKICYREFLEDQMKRNAVGKIVSQCITCYDIIGKGPGYTDKSNTQTEEDWFDGSTKRMSKLKQEGKL